MRLVPGRPPGQTEMRPRLPAQPATWRTHSAAHFPRPAHPSRARSLPRPAHSLLPLAHLTRPLSSALRNHSSSNAAVASATAPVLPLWIATGAAAAGAYLSIETFALTRRIIDTQRNIGNDAHQAPQTHARRPLETSPSTSRLNVQSSLPGADTGLPPCDGRPGEPAAAARRTCGGLANSCTRK